MRRQSTSPCPVNSCLAANPNQRALYDDELKKITGRAREIIDKATLSVKRCVYCGAVYVKELSIVGPDKIQLLGEVDPSMRGDGWFPYSGYE